MHAFVDRPRNRKSKKKRSKQSDGPQALDTWGGQVQAGSKPGSDCQPTRHEDQGHSVDQHGSDEELLPFEADDHLVPPLRSDPIHGSDLHATSFMFLLGTLVGIRTKQADAVPDPKNGRELPINAQNGSRLACHHDLENTI